MLASAGVPYVVLAAESHLEDGSQVGISVDVPVVVIGGLCGCVGGSTQEEGAKLLSHYCCCVDLAPTALCNPCLTSVMRGRSIDVLSGWEGSAGGETRGMTADPVFAVVLLLVCKETARLPRCSTTEKIKLGRDQVQDGLEDSTH